MGFDDVQAGAAVLAAAQEIMFLELMLVKIVDIVHGAASSMTAGKPDRLSSEISVHLKTGWTLADSGTRCIQAAKLSLFFSLHNKKPWGGSPFVSLGSIRVRIKK